MNTWIIIFLSLLSVSAGRKLGVRDYRFIHAFPPGGPVDVYINYNLVFSDQNFQAITDYSQNIEVTDHEAYVSLVPAGQSANATLATACFNTNSTASVLILWRLNTYGAPYLEVSNTTETCAAATRSGANYSSFIFYNLDASGNFPFTVINYEGGNLLPQINANSWSGFTEVPSGLHALNFIGPMGSLTLNVTMQPRKNYALALWGSVTFPNSVTTVTLMSCNPPAIPLPVPPSPPPLVITQAVANAVAQQSETEWIWSVNTYLQSLNGQYNIDDYAARWFPSSVYNGLFFPSGPYPQTPTQTAATIKAYLNSVPRVI